MRDPLDREGMWEEAGEGEGRELERGPCEVKEEDFAPEEEEDEGEEGEEEEEEALVGLVASELCADWELLLVEELG